LRLILGKYLNKTNYKKAKEILANFCRKHNIKFDEKLLFVSRSPSSRDFNKPVDEFSSLSKQFKEIYIRIFHTRIKKI